MAPRAYRITLGAILALAAGARLLDLSADAPLDASRDFSFTTDGAWYAGAALERAAGRTGAGGGPYDRPVFTALMEGSVRILGPGIPAAALVAALSGIGAIALTASAARKIHGPGAGLVAAGLLSFDYAFLIHGRAPNIYSTVALAAAAVIRLSAKGPGEEGPGWKSLLLAWGVTVSGALWLKSILWLLAPALLAAAPPPEALRRKLSRPGMIAGISAALALAAGLAVASGMVDSTAHKLKEYLLTGPGPVDGEGGGILWSIATIERRTGLAALSPALFILFSWRVLRAGKPGGGAGERLAALHVLGSMAVLAPLQYSPLRYLIPVYPALAVLASGAFLELSGRDPGGVPRLRWWRAFRPAAGGYLILQGLQALSGAPSGLGLTLMALVACFLAVAFEWGTGPVQAGTAARLLRGSVLALSAAFALAGLSRGGTALAEPRHSLENAGREIDAIVSPCAHLTGLFAHALTYRSPLQRTYVPRLVFGGGSLGRSLRAKGFTHLAVEIAGDQRPLFSAFASDGAALELVWEFMVRGSRVGLYRFPWAEEICPLSDFERGVGELRRGRPLEAEAHLLRALELRPRFAAAAAALGICLMEKKRESEAAPHFEEALEWNPDELQAARALLSIRLKDRDLEAARALIRRISEADPQDPEIARLSKLLLR